VVAKTSARTSDKSMACAFHGNVPVLNALPHVDFLCHRALISNFLISTEPRAVEDRRHNRFKRKRFWCAGVNDIWCQDQHDKWLRFGLYFHNSVDPFMSYNNWLKVWWTNKNPKLITSFYIEAARKTGGNVSLILCPQNFVS
jgi:hypothetical protein